MLDNANCLSKVDVAPKKKLATGFKALHPMMDLMAECTSMPCSSRLGQFGGNLATPASFKLCVIIQAGKGIRRKFWQRYRLEEGTALYVTYSLRIVQIHFLKTHWHHFLHLLRLRM